MRVSLAAQVLSSSVADALKYLGKDDTSETESFVCLMDTFFDCMNVRSTVEGTRKLKPNLMPYYSQDDDRLKWLENEFLQYFANWEESVQKRAGFIPAEKTRMLLSKETMSGLRITVKSFVELARYLLNQEGVSYLLSEHFNQDPLEQFFGKQRAQGARCDNPTIQQFMKNSVSIRQQKSASLAPLRGNSTRRSSQLVIDDTPLPKRRRLFKQ